MTEPSITRAEADTASFDAARQAFVIPVGLLQRHIPERWATYVRMMVAGSTSGDDAASAHRQGGTTMRSLKVAAITAALILVPVAVVHATQAPSPGGPATFACKQWAELPWGAKVISVTPTSVTFRTAFNKDTIRWEPTKGNGIRTIHVLSGEDPPTPYVFILTNEDVAANPNLAVQSIHSGKGIIVRRSYASPTHALGVWHCAY